MADDQQRCPTCGQAVRVESSDEGTAYYVGTDPRAIERDRRIAELDAEVNRLRDSLEQCKSGRWHLHEDVVVLQMAVARLRDAIEEYALWEPGRAGHAEAHRKLLAAARSTNA
jgi:hypothetical protein